MKQIILPMEREFRAPLCASPVCREEAAWPLFFCQAHQLFLVDGAEAKREQWYGENDAA